MAFVLLAAAMVAIFTTALDRYLHSSNGAGGASSKNPAVLTDGRPAIVDVGLLQPDLELEAWAGGLAA